MEERRDEAQDELDGRIREELRAGFPSAAFPATQIELRMRRSVSPLRDPGATQGAATQGMTSEPAMAGGKPWVRVALAAAAALVLFIGGIEYGRGLEGRGAAITARVPMSADQTLSLPLEIQSAGSRYVATLARFSEEGAALTEQERRIAREVALAVLYGAALELVREAGEDEVLRSVADMVAERRGAASAIETTPPSGF